MIDWIDWLKDAPWTWTGMYIVVLCVMDTPWKLLPPFPRTGAIPSNYIHVWALCTDNGPDQASFRNSLKTELASQPGYKNQLMFDCPCLKHQLHLLTADMLRIISKFLSSCGKEFSYFGSLAKICHTWRAHGPKLSKVWRHIVPNAYSFTACCAVPPLAVAGRWGSIDCNFGSTFNFILDMFGCFLSWANLLPAIRWSHYLIQFKSFKSPNDWDLRPLVIPAN